MFARIQSPFRSTPLLIVILVWNIEAAAQSIGFGIVTAYEVAAKKGSIEKKLPRNSRFEILSVKKETPEGTYPSKFSYRIKTNGEILQIPAHIPDEKTASVILYTRKTEHAVIVLDTIPVYREPIFYSERIESLHFKDSVRVSGKSADYDQKFPGDESWLQIQLPEEKIGYIKNTGIEETDNPKSLLASGFLKYDKNGWVEISDENLQAYLLRRGRLVSIGKVPKLSLGLSPFQEILRSTNGESYYRVAAGMQSTNGEASSDGGFDYYLSSDKSKVYDNYLTYSSQKDCRNLPEDLIPEIQSGRFGKDIDLCHSSSQTFKHPSGAIHYASLYWRNRLHLPGDNSIYRGGIGTTVLDYLFIPGESGYIGIRFQDRKLQWVDFDGDGSPELFAKAEASRVSPISFLVYRIGRSGLELLFQKEGDISGCLQVEPIDRKLKIYDSCKPKSSAKYLVFSNGKFGAD